METRKIYCSACDRDVTVVLVTHGKEEPRLQGARCLDIGERCTGAMCPICARPPGEMIAETEIDPC